ncbi:MAG: DUF402 domain-containing protein [Dehalococcoidia bacterium]|nr:DUF402 domain-containing protein [Dehalococcoidia bacterium]
MEPEHTPATGTGATAVVGSPVIERKRKPDGSWREYACTLALRAPGLVVVRFPLPAGAGAFATPVPVPAGSFSDGYFWERRPYTLYRLRGPDGAPIAHRFDAATEVRLAPGTVEYRDLVLDWWVLPSGEIVEEDREELEALTAAGAIGPAERAAITAAERAILGRYRHIIDEAARIERRLPA